eukprot:NODE_347_length_919_cov_404.693182_g339_i0.p1 GENE.NODE_347_length_919_cov_404.693182_g339_i0~~NODE_347_length_919_cov_404.693182_g339_i0.p1  ORF type:complete len:167 (+),score=16.48 NODE_347_length_919_cov_404.693182_g339_i0:79-579(+)
MSAETTVERLQHAQEHISRLTLMVLQAAQRETKLLEELYSKSVRISSLENQLNDRALQKSLGSQSTTELVNLVQKATQGSTSPHHTRRKEKPFTVPSIPAVQVAGSLQAIQLCYFEEYMRQSLHLQECEQRAELYRLHSVLTGQRNRIKFALEDVDTLSPSWSNYP